ncbi:YggS family pyridoxal phosphate-dependent enzyme [Rubellicoccus peritrichatus]|uniref:Pyridoxal phosphate homeostasis protein n=1 Tax=Rubellicoccus peritrichatus TaxID=3080537 RepID=A0AAQ3LGK2_9BACT|nr:YggS family pyridoxal phosphate-dependent enzyme [Puniceicoccus sp. CR14]WOO41734.1 YggS family pyridoxal phosphate-dependent enzyme [Puniceicoccus sp. CR14]
MATTQPLEANLNSIRSRISNACELAKRSTDEVQILPVTKTHSAAIVELAKNAGFNSVGENRVQEAAEKKQSALVDIRWELIGHLQSNKCRQAVEIFDRIHSVDSLKLVKRLDTAAAELGKKLPILLQFNTGEDPAKYGAKVDQADVMMEACLNATHLKLQGFMTIAPLDDNRDVALNTFVKLRELRDHCSQKFSHEMPELSMGMSGDLEQAIAAGSTLIRVGSALFGSRPPL